MGVGRRLSLVLFWVDSYRREEIHSREDQKEAGNAADNWWGLVGCQNATLVLVASPLFPSFCGSMCLRNFQFSSFPLASSSFLARWKSGLIKTHHLFSPSSFLVCGKYKLNGENWILFFFLIFHESTRLHHSGWKKKEEEGWRQSTLSSSSTIEKLNRNGEGGK